ncbi:AraC family ligand binding domain-containing protein [Paenibacillus rhizoplanae]
MKQLFEPVLFAGRQTLIWDYQLYTDDHYKGYYHWHQCCEIMFVHRGQGSIVVNQQMYDIRPGMLFFSSSLISCTGSPRTSHRIVRSYGRSSILIP